MKSSIGDSSKPTDLKTLREALGITQATLAEYLGVTQAYISSLEKGLRQNDQLVHRATDYLKNVVAPGRSKSLEQIKPSLTRHSRRSIVHHESAGVLNWAWSSFSKLRDTSDIYDHASIDSKNYALIIADIVGHGTRGSWQAAQLRFGFHALASTLSKHNNHPAGYIGPLGNALVETRSRFGAPPSLAIACLDCASGIISHSVFGLPAPILYQRRNSQQIKQNIQAADLLNKGLSSVDSITTTLDEGDSLIMCTDGFYEWLKESKRLTASVISELFNEAARNFYGDSNAIVNAIITAKNSDINSDFTDDATIVVVSRAKRSRSG